MLMARGTAPLGRVEGPYRPWHRLAASQRRPYGAPVCGRAGNTRKTDPRRTDRCPGRNGAPHSTDARPQRGPAFLPKAPCAYSQPLLSKAACTITQPLLSRATCDLSQPLLSKAACQIRQPLLSKAACQIRQPLLSRAACDLSQPLLSGGAWGGRSPPLLGVNVVTAVRRVGSVFSHLSFP